MAVLVQKKKVNYKWMNRRKERKKEEKKGGREEGRKERRKEKQTGTKEKQ